MTRRNASFFVRETRVLYTTVMAKALLSLDASHMPSAKSLTSQLVPVKLQIRAEWKSGMQGWLGLPDDVASIARAKKVLAKAPKGIDTLLVIGIGGSDLGTRAIWHALALKSHGMRLVFAGGNTDPDELEEVLAGLDLSKTLVNIVSKSGDTIEPMSAFLIVRERLKKAVGKSFASHIVATTGIGKGSLWALAEKEGYATVPVPTNVGGRFSVLSDVGIFPVVAAGLNASAMLRGAKWVRDSFFDEAATFAAMQYEAATKQKQKIHVLMPYASSLHPFAFWYRQLWAESLGKKGKGPTPVAALGATDQHSQLQLYMEGPSDKTFTFIDVARFDHDVTVPNADIVPSLSFLSGHKLSRIIHAEREGTSGALTKAKRPNMTLTVPKVDEASLGALFMFFQIAVAAYGHLSGVNPYDQPGVEEGKKIAHRILSA